MVGIDNDEVFKIPISRTTNKGKSEIDFVRLLEQMNKDLSTSTQLLIKYLDPTILLLRWLIDLSLQEKRYEDLKETLIKHGEGLRKVYEDADAV